jgi:hypothetical protein
VLFLVSCSHRVIASGVGEPILDQNQRFHCPIYFLRYSLSRNHKPNHSNDLYGFTIEETMSLSEAVLVTPNGISSNQITSTSSFTNKLLELSKSFITTREVTVKPNDAPWITIQIKKLIHKRKNITTEPNTHRTRTIGTNLDNSVIKSSHLYARLNITTSYKWQSLSSQTLLHKRTGENLSNTLSLPLKNKAFLHLKTKSTMNLFLIQN